MRCVCVCVDSGRPGGGLCDVCVLACRASSEGRLVGRGGGMLRTVVSIGLSSAKCGGRHLPFFHHLQRVKVLYCLPTTSWWDKLSAASQQHPAPLLKPSFGFSTVNNPVLGRQAPYPLLPPNNDSDIKSNHWLVGWLVAERSVVSTSTKVRTPYRGHRTTAD